MWQRNHAAGWDADVHCVARSASAYRAPACRANSPVSEVVVQRLLERKRSKSSVEDESTLMRVSSSSSPRMASCK